MIRVGLNLCKPSDIVSNATNERSKEYLPGFPSKGKPFSFAERGWDTGARLDAVSNLLFLSVASVAAKSTAGVLLTESMTPEPGVVWVMVADVAGSRTVELERLFVVSPRFSLSKGFRTCILYQVIVHIRNISHTIGVGLTGSTLAIIVAGGIPSAALTASSIVSGKTIGLKGADSAKSFITVWGFSSNGFRSYIAKYQAMHISGKIKATFFSFLDGTAVGSMEHRLEPATGAESVVFSSLLLMALTWL